MECGVRIYSRAITVISVAITTKLGHIPEAHYR